MKKIINISIIIISISLCLSAETQSTYSVEKFLEAKQLKLKNSNLLNNDKIFDSDSYDILNISSNNPIKMKSIFNLFKKKLNPYAKFIFMKQKQSQSTF